jgi:hypothetical protein
VVAINDAGCPPVAIGASTVDSIEASRNCPLYPSTMNTEIVLSNEFATYVDCGVRALGCIRVLL